MFNQENAMEETLTVDQFCQFVTGNLGAIDETKLYTVQGIYQPDIRNASDGKNWRCEKLADEKGGKSIVIRTSSKQREYAGTVGDVINVEGKIKFNDKEGSILRYSLIAKNITKTTSARKLSENDIDKVYALLEYGRQPCDADLSLFRMFAHHETPTIGVICCENSMAWEDFEVGLAEAKDKYLIDEIATVSSSAEDYTQAVREADKKDYDVICIMRGGGSGIDKIDSCDFIKAVAESNTPIMIGLGHCKDNLFSKFVASSTCGTPQGLGQRLKEIARITESAYDKIDVLSGTSSLSPICEASPFDCEFDIDRQNFLVEYKPDITQILEDMKEKVTSHKNHSKGWDEKDKSEILMLIKYLLEPIFLVPFWFCLLMALFVMFCGALLVTVRNLP